MFCFLRNVSHNILLLQCSHYICSDHQPLTALNLAILKDLWMPDVEIRNLQSFETHTILSKLEGLWVDEDHNLMHALASRITFICPMRFNSFPMDVQVVLLTQYLKLK